MAFVPSVCVASCQSQASQLGPDDSSRMRKSIVPTQQNDDGLLASMDRCGVDSETARDTLQGDAESLQVTYEAILDELLTQDRCARSADVFVPMMRLFRLEIYFASGQGTLASPK